MSRPCRILLDTSVIIDLADVELGDHESAEPAVSAVSVAELAFGLDIDDPIERRARRAVPRCARAVRRADLRRPRRLAAGAPTRHSPPIGDEAVDTLLAEYAATVTECGTR